MTHLCLVSDQPVPNYLPLRHQATKPEKVILAVTEKMKLKTAWLQRAIERLQIEVSTLELPSAFDLPLLQEFFLGWLDSSDAAADVMLNVTGGTKPMAIAAQEAFRMADKPVFYINIDNDELVWLDRKRESIKMTPNLSLKNFLTIHGFEIVDSAENIRLSAEWATFARDLAKDGATTWGKSLRTLNYYAMRAQERDVLDVGRITADNVPHWNDLMDSLFYNEIISKQDRLTFKSPEARAFANGGWLEYLVFEAVKDIGGIKKPLLNLKIKDSTGNQNELDVAFLARNRLHIIECKTKRLDARKDEIEGPAADTIYKLDSLRKAGGLRTKGILVSFRPIAAPHKRRAEESGITVIDQQGLSRLKELLANEVL